MDEYPIYFAQERIGTAKVIQEGLYYRICCLCEISGSIPFCVKVTGSAEADLGLCVPMEGCFGIETRIPVKRVGIGKLQFRAMPRHTARAELTAVSPDEPFGYITRLKDAYLIKRDALTGVGFRVTGQFQGLPDSGRNP